MPSSRASIPEEINEDALVGAIGARILSRYRVTFDLHEGRIELALPEGGRRARRGSGATGGTAR